MFNPKENLLDQQLAVSGLEMNIVGVIAGISAVASVVGGISATLTKRQKTIELPKKISTEKAAKGTGT